MQQKECRIYAASGVLQTPKSDYKTEEMRYISLPLTGFSQTIDHSPEQPSSYRMVIKGLPPTNGFDMMLSLQGLVYGNYETYIDGHQTYAMLPPYSYPTYYFPVPESGTVEIVIQTSRTASLLNITPRIAFKGLAMEDLDVYRNMILILTGAILTAYIIMMVLMFSLDRRYLYLPFVTGFLFTLNYLLNTLWATGYQGVLTSLVPQYLLPHFAWLMLAGGLAMTCMAPETVYISSSGRRMLRFILILLGCALAVRALDLLVLHTAIGILISDFITAAVVLIQLYLTYRWMNQISQATFLLQIGLFLMITGMASASLHQIIGFWNIFLYTQPVTIIIYSGLVFYNNKAKQIHLLKRTRELLEVEKHSTQVQTAMLSSQIQPHFLYNTLTTIQELCYSDPDEAAELIVTFSQYLRNNLDFMNYEDLVPFSKELDHIHNFMYIQNARHKNAIEYIEDISVRDFLLPPLSVQPIVENAVKHGIMKEYAKGRVTLKVYKDGDLIHILVKNDGSRFTEADLKKGHSMDNIRTRLKHLVNGKLQISFDQDSGETCVELIIPQKD